MERRNIARLLEYIDKSIRELQTERNIGMYHRTNNSTQSYSSLLSGRRPFARAELLGSVENPSITGTVDFFATPLGVVVSTQISGSAVVTMIFFGV